MPARHRTPRNRIRRLCIGFGAVLAAVSLALVAASPVAAAGPAAASGHSSQPARPSIGQPPSCTTQTVVFGVLPDMRTVTRSVVVRSTRGQPVAAGAVTLGRLPVSIRAIAALDSMSFVVADSGGALRLVTLTTLARAGRQGFALHVSTLATTWQADQLAYDGAGHLFVLSSGELIRYSLANSGRGIVVGDAEPIAGTYALADLFAVGADQLVGISASGAWTMYTIDFAPPQPPPPAPKGGKQFVPILPSAPLNASTQDLGTAPQYRNVVQAGLGRFLAQSPAGVLVSLSLPVAALEPQLTAADLAAVAALNGTAPPSAPKPAAKSVAGGATTPLAGPTLLATVARGWTHSLLSAAPSACDSTVPAPTDAVRTIGQTRSSNGFVAGWCTEGAAMMFEAASGLFMDIRGNAWRWGDSARAAGWTVSATPQPNAVVVFGPNVLFARGIAAGGLGHVAWVDAVAHSGNDIWFHVLEMNGPAGRGQWDQVWAKYDPRTNPVTGEPNMQFVLAPYSDLLPTQYAQPAGYWEAAPDQP